MKRIKSMGFSTVFVVFFLTFITIYAELSEGFKNILKSLSGHHWITKSIISFVLFFLVYFFTNRSDEKINPLHESWRIIWVTLLCSLIILGFFIWHFLA